MKVPKLDRITFDPQVMGGKACLRGPVSRSHSS